MKKTHSYSSCDEAIEHKFRFIDNKSTVGIPSSSADEGSCPFNDQDFVTFSSSPEKDLEFTSDSEINEAATGIAHDLAEEDFLSVPVNNYDNNIDELYTKVSADFLTWRTSEQTSDQRSNASDDHSGSESSESHSGCEQENLICSYVSEQRQIRIWIDQVFCPQPR